MPWNAWFLLPFRPTQSWDRLRRCLMKSTPCAAIRARSVLPAPCAALMEGSEIRESHRDGDTRVQDPYCIRCQPQVTGAALDLLDFAGRTLEIEANAVSDNPLVLVETGQIVSGGNFHAEPVAFAADQIALADCRDRFHCPTPCGLDGRPDLVP